MQENKEIHNQNFGQILEGEAQDQMSLELGAMRSSLLVLLLLVTSGLGNPISSNNLVTSRLDNPLSFSSNKVSRNIDTFKNVGFVVHTIR